MIRRRNVRSALIGLVVLALLAQARLTFAHEEDTHCILTYIACVAAGFTADEATLVAFVDQGMDDSPGVVAVGGLGGIIPNIPEEWLWHAIDRQGLAYEMGARGVLRRKEHLWRIALTRKTPRERLEHLGVFFHYQQDTWAHRHHYEANHLSKDAFTTYNTPAGHAYHGHQPDRPPFDPVAAFLCLEDTMLYAREFAQTSLKRDSQVLFKDAITPFAGVFQDDAWRDPRKGKYVHMLGGRDATKPQAFLLELIQGQVMAYKVSSDQNPLFDSPTDNPFYAAITADLVGLEPVAKAFNLTCLKYGVKGSNFDLLMGPSKQNLGLKDLTTEGLITDVAFTGAAGQNSSATSAMGLQANETVSINGKTDLSSIIQANDGGCVFGIKLTTSPWLYDYVVEVDARGPKGLTSGSMYLNFTDETGDTYALRIFDSSRRTHTVTYNSKQPTITKIRWSNTGNLVTGQIPNPGTKAVNSFGGSGGNPFSDPDGVVRRGPITMVAVGWGNDIDYLRLHYGYGGNGKDGMGGEHGGSGWKTILGWTVPPGEHIVRVEGRSGSRIDRLQFFTDQGHSSPVFGGNGGTAFTVKDDLGRPLRTISGRGEQNRSPDVRVRRP